MRVLSTKKLLPNQKELLLNANISFVEYDFISIEPVDFHVEGTLENIIFTSQNAVKAFVAKISALPLPKWERVGVRAFCVGDKTGAYLEEHGFKVLEKAYTAKKLAERIVKNHARRSFVFFCGEKKREELPQLLRQHNIALKEIEVYRTKLTPKMITGSFNGILFFSPSAVESYVQKNNFEEAIAFCIGKTTEKELKKHTNNVITAKKPSVENVIVQVVKHFK